MTRPRRGRSRPPSRPLPRKAHPAHPPHPTQSALLLWWSRFRKLILSGGALAAAITACLALNLDSPLNPSDSMTSLDSAHTKVALADSYFIEVCTAEAFIRAARKPMQIPAKSRGLNVSRLSWQVIYRL